MKKIDTKFPGKLNILFVTPELSPFVKEGWLADMVESLSGSFFKSRHDVRIVIPFYKVICQNYCKIDTILETMCVWMGNKEEWCKVVGTKSKIGVPVYFIEHNEFFNRCGLYQDSEHNEYQDNPRRFGFFCQAALQLCKDIKFKPDIIHLNDWQTSLICAYLKLWHWNDPFLSNSASVLTIHNISDQGIYPKCNMNYLGLGWDNFTPEKFEFYDKINFLKGGIYYSDKIVKANHIFPEQNEFQSEKSDFSFHSQKHSTYPDLLTGINYNSWNMETIPLEKNKRLYLQEYKQAIFNKLKYNKEATKYYW